MNKTDPRHPLNRLRHHVSGAIERGEAQPVLDVRETWQTPLRGSNDAEYAIYIERAKSLGWPVKSYDEWLAS